MYEQERAQNCLANEPNYENGSPVNLQLVNIAVRDAWRPQSPSTLGDLPLENTECLWQV